LSGQELTFDLCVVTISDKWATVGEEFAPRMQKTAGKIDKL